MLGNEAFDRLLVLFRQDGRHPAVVVVVAAVTCVLVCLLSIDFFIFFIFLFSFGAVKKCVMSVSCYLWL